MLATFITCELGFETKKIVSRIYDIHREYIDGGIIGFRPPIAYADAVDKGEVLVVVDLNKSGVESIIGFAHYRRLKNKTVRLYAIAIESSLRGGGIGTLLLSHLETCYGTKIKTEVRLGNSRSLEFFKKNNYKIVGEKDKKNYRVYLVEKKLTASTRWMYDASTGDMLHINTLRFDK